MKKVIDGKEFAIEYGSTALIDCSECIEQVLNLIRLNEQKDIPLNKRFETIMKDVPQITLLLFYAGLLEHHSETITDINSAKRLLKKYFKENKEATFFVLLAELTEQMGEDNFLSMFGIDLALDNMTAQAE